MEAWSLDGPGLTVGQLLSSYLTLLYCQNLPKSMPRRLCVAALMSLAEASPHPK